MRSLRADPSRLALPLIISLILFGAYMPFRHKPLFVGSMDVASFLQFAAYAALIFFFVRAIDFILFDLLFSKRRRVVAPQILRGIVSIVLYVLLFASAIHAAFLIDVKTWLAGGAVVAAVLALALQDTLGNMFAGIALTMEETFEVGDVIHIGDFMGVVEHVSWRATRMRGYDNQIMVLPNSMLARERLEMFPRNNLNGRVLSFAVDQHIAPATVIAVLTQAASHVEGVARELPTHARVSAFGDSSVVYEIKYYTRDFAARDRIDADIRKAVWYALRRNNIALSSSVLSYQPYTPPPGDHHASPEEIYERLRDVDVLGPLSDGAVRALAENARMHFYSRGEAILRHGTVGDSMFIIHSGNVVVRAPDDSLTGWHQIAHLGPGGFFGEMALLTGEMRSADVVALSDVVAVEIAKDSLQPILNDHPELTGAISHKILQRKEHLENVLGATAEEEELTLMSKIRSYFGL